MKDLNKKQLEAAAKLSKIDAELSKVLSDNNVILDRYRAKVNEAQQRIDQANKLLLDATEQGDADAYHKAKDALRAAQDAKELHQAMLERKKSAFLIERPTADNYYKTIQSLHSDYEKATADRICELALEIEKMFSDYDELTATCNRTLEKVFCGMLHTDKALCETVTNSLNGICYVRGLDTLKAFIANYERK